MKTYLRHDEMLPGEEVLAAAPYRPFSILIVTNRRVVGKRLLRLGPHRFEGSLLWKDLMEIRYIPRRPLISTPKLVIQYRTADGSDRTATIRFPGFISRLGGFDPAEIYSIMLAQLREAGGGQ